MNSNQNPPIFYFVLLAILLIFIGIYYQNNNYRMMQQSVQELTGKPLPALDLPMLNNPDQHLTNKTFIGNVVLLNVWGSWCGACRAEHSTLMMIKNQYHIPIYGIDYQDSTEDAIRYLQQEGNPFIEVGADPAGITGKSLGILGTPETFIVDKNGIIQFSHIGTIDEYSWENELLPLIKQLQASNHVSE